MPIAMFLNTDTYQCIAQYILQKAFIHKLDILVLSLLIGSAYFFQNRTVGFVQ